ncbi:MAG TPA: hypothetical protein VL025_00225 [Thermoanaerobaculia bacterium]|nr:hypothetical protein [Thermoanaerobaculia bacterium]
MEDQQLGRLLRDLPEERARPGFTTRVLARLDEPGRRPFAWWPRLALAGIPAALLVGGISVGLLGARPESLSPERAAEARQILDELRAEQERLEQDFQTLRGTEDGDVIYLGGNEEIDLVVDMSNVPKGDGTVPAAYRPDETF